MRCFAAFARQKYEVIVTLDDDLASITPEEIPRLLARLEEGFDVIYGARQSRAKRDYAGSRIPHHPTGAARGHWKRGGEKT